MATGMISPIMDTEEARLQDQLATAAALRKQSLAAGAGSPGAGYQGGKVFMVGGGPLGQIAQALGGAYMDSRAREGLGGIEQARNQEREQFMSSMPEATEVAPQFGPGMDGGSLPDVTRDKSPEQQAQEMRRWASGAPRGMESVQQFALQQHMLAPQQAAARRDQQEARRLEMSIRAEEAAKEAQARRDWEEKQARIRAQEKRDNIILAKTLGGGGSTTADLDRQIKELRIKQLEGKLDAPKQLPVGAQTHQRSLQNLESGLAAYEALLKDYDPQSKDVGTDKKRAAIKSAFTDLQMNLKGAYELGAITGPDMEVLQGAITDPTSVWGMVRGGVGGRDPFEAQISQAKAGLNRSKRNFEQQYGVTLPTPAGQMQAPMPGATAPSEFKVLGVRDK